MYMLIITKILGGRMNMRTCEHCEMLIINGWINEDYEEYYCSSECLEVYHPNFMQQVTGRIYFTSWDVYTFDGVQYVNEDDAKYTAYKNGFNCMDVTAVNFDLNKPLYRFNDSGQLAEINVEEIAV